MHLPFVVALLATTFRLCAAVRSLYNLDAGIEDVYSGTFENIEQTMYNTNAGIEDVYNGSIENFEKIIPGQQKFSQQRQACIAEDDLNLKMFPPDFHPNAAIRLVLPGMPVVGDVHLVIGRLDFTEMDLELTISRENVADAVFKFTISGVQKGRGNAKTKAKIKAWFEDLDFKLPQSGLKTVATIEHGVGKLANYLSMGYTGDYGRVDRGPIDIDLTMSALFRYNSVANNWTIVPKSAKQDVYYTFGPAGALMTIANQIVRSFGGIDTIFFDTIWPQVAQLIPVELGAVFEKVPHESGNIEHKFRIKGWCPDTQKRRCPSQNLEMKVTDTTTLHGLPLPLLRRFVFGNETEEGSDSNLTEQIKQMSNRYQELKKRENIFSGLAASSEVNVDFSGDDNRLDVKFEPHANIPLRFMEVTKPEVNLNDFSPQDGSPVIASAEMYSKDGVVSIPRLALSNLTLPVDGGEILMGAWLEDVTIEVEDGEVPDPMSYFLSADSIITVNAPGVVATLAHNSDTGSILKLKPRDNQTAVTVSLEPDYVKGLLINATAALRHPYNVRNGSFEDGDGPVPVEFDKPFDKIPPTLDLMRTIKKMRVSGNIDVKAVEVEVFRRNLRKEIIQVAASLTADITLDLGAHFFQGVLEGQVSDFGYLNILVEGYYGKLIYQHPPEKKAVIRMSCGGLEIYDVPKAYNPKEEFKLPPRHFASIREFDTREQINIKLISGGTYIEHICIFVERFKGGLFATPYNNYFCAITPEVKTLYRAIKLQRKRMRDTFRRLRSTKCKDQNECEFAYNPDGTWFKKWDPKDLSTYFPMRVPPDLGEVTTVMSPLQRFAQTIKHLN